MCTSTTATASLAVSRVVLLAALLPTATCAGKALPGSAKPRQAVATLATLPAPTIFLHSAAGLMQHKARWQADPQHPEPALVRLLDDASKAMRETPFSVTDKAVLPPSGDKHDYLSLAPYAWPDPAKPGGLPYLFRDGQINPERDTIPDHTYFSRLAALTETLGLAYYFTADEAYAQQAARLLRTFFIAPATRMNPHLNYGQVVPGKEGGRPSGIVDSAPIARLIDGVQLLGASKSWPDEDRQALEGWFRAYLLWLRESDLGRKEGQARNNHGTWYDVQVATLALATAQPEVASEVLAFGRKRRVGREIEPDGRQPEELRRTRSWHYAVFNLQAFVALANLGQRAGVDLWRYQTPDGRSLRKAIDWLIPFALGKQAWTSQDLDGMKPAALWPIVREAAAVLHDRRLGETAAALGQDPGARLLLFLE
jgi:hypothetical protein